MPGQTPRDHKSQGNGMPGMGKDNAASIPAATLKKSTRLKQRRRSDQTLGNGRTVLHATLPTPHRRQEVGPMVGSILWVGKLSLCIQWCGCLQPEFSNSLPPSFVSPWTKKRKERITFRSSLGGGQMTGK